MPAERMFAYLDASGRLEAENIRRLIDEWFGRLPATDRLEWRSRFRSDSDVDHCAAFFELLLHEWLLRLDYSVDLHPQIEGTSNRPDFRVRKSDRTSFYVEACTTLGMSPDERRSKHFFEQIKVELQKIASPDFFVHITIVRLPIEQPQLRNFRGSVSGWLTSLDYDAVSRTVGQPDHEKFRKEFLVGDGLLELEPWPKGKKRGTPDILGGESFGATQVDTQGPIQGALGRKAGRYGTLDAPYIVAISDLSEFPREDHVYEAVFGREVIRFREGDHRPRVALDNSGFFGQPHNWKYTRVSAVLIVTEITPWNLARSFPIFVEHPAAQKPIGRPFGNCLGFYMERGTLRRSETKVTMADVFCLGPDWPRQTNER